MEGDAEMRHPITFVSATLALAVSASVWAQDRAGDAQLADLTSLSLEALMNIQVTSVSQVAEPLSAAPAAIQVINAEDIRRSGARNLPEVLRLATGLQVAQIDNRSWAITARGFNNSLADKLEVRLDGRSLYTPLFSGVLWEMQDPLLQDIERIEVIRGPGAEVWGANAVNGVINIVTKSAAQTPGTYLSLHAGNELEHHVSVREGLDLGTLGAWRVYAQSREHDTSQSGSAGVTSVDGLRVASAGLRGDLSLSVRDSLMLSLNAQDAEAGTRQSRSGDTESLTGVDLIARWTRIYSDRSDLRVQLSADHFRRDIPGFYGETRRQVDLDLRHRWQASSRHELIWGGAWRVSADHIRNSDAVIFDPSRRRLQTASLFLRDRISLADDLTLTLGSRFEHNDYTGFEYQPTARLSWQLDPKHTLWSTLSRATRSPNRVDRDYNIPSADPQGISLVGNTKFQSERAQVAELGWRQRFSDRLSLDMVGFYADYDRLRGITFLDAQSVAVSNEGRGHGYGAEISAIWVPHEDVRVWLGYTYLHIDFGAYPGSTDITIAGANEQDPAHAVNLRVAWDLSRRISTDLQWRFVDELEDPGVPSYLELDLNLAYKWTPQLHFELAGRNLLDRHHPEFNDGRGANLERAIHAGVVWEF